MADYIVTGQRGAGKSLVMCGRIKKTLLAGRRVATNLDINLMHLLPHSNKTARLIRLPDRPTGEDLKALGEGGDSPRESQFGDLILDELAVWLNAREWNDKTRSGVIAWMVQSRKYRWNTFMITQLLKSLDNQVRGLLEHHVACYRTDRIRIPVIGGLVSGLSSIFGAKGGTLPQIHIGHVSYGFGAHATFSERWVNRGHELWNCYNTEQKFSDDYPHGSYSVLPPWYLVDRSGYWSGDTYVSFPLYNSPDGVLYGWKGRPAGWDREPPLKPPKPVNSLQPLFDVANFLVDAFSPVLEHI